MTGGHRFFMAALAQVSDDQLSAPSALPGWTGRHILSHVGHNARAVGRLAYWAATGVPTPMYPGPTARAEEIALGAHWEAQRLRSFVEFEQDALAAALPWLRTRELWIHATDLCDAADFSEFPPVLLDDLIVDVLRQRRDANGEIVLVRPTDRDRTPRFDGPAPPAWIEGRTADLAGWLTGRGATNIHTSDDSALPTLRPWL